VTVEVYPTPRFIKGATTCKGALQLAAKQMLAPSLSKFGPLAVSRNRKGKLTALWHHITIDADPDPVIELIAA
jgi:hypothetical protein